MLPRVVVEAKAGGAGGDGAVGAAAGAGGAAATDNQAVRSLVCGRVE